VNAEKESFYNKYFRIAEEILKKIGSIKLDKYGPELEQLLTEMLA